MNTCAPAAKPPGWQRVLACAAVWLALWPLSLAHGVCPPILPTGEDFPELEPNNTVYLAQPWPVMQPVVGEQTSQGDPDFFYLDGLAPDASFQITLTPDTFNPRLRLWALRGGLWQLQQDVDQTGVCEAEQLVQAGWDPCQILIPVERYALQVSRSVSSPNLTGSYRAAVVPASNSVPLGDCCQYPIAIPNGLTYTDTQTTSVAFRDMGFGPSPDVWYQLVLDAATVLTAQTCGGSTTFDTVLRVVAADCSTVLAVNDNSARCAPSLVESWLSATLQAGTYYVVVEGSGNASGTFTLTLRMATCPGVVPGPGALVEIEPNDEPWLAQPWPVGQQLYGEQSVLGDADYFRLLSAGPQDGYVVSIQPDTFDPVLKVYAESAAGLQLVAEVDNGGVCEMESVTIAGWDPCTQLIPITGWIIGVGQGMAGPALGGAYLGSALTVSSNVPVGDCCQFPIAVGSLPFTDNRDTSVSYRDMGFGPAPDVWYQLVLEQGGVLTAQTCGGQTTFDTVLRVVDDDCVTVLASNDNSQTCGVGSVQSWLATCLTAGTYYVVVEGSDTASGLFTLSLALRPSGAGASLVVGDWGRLAEEWHQHYSNGSSTLWLLADDLCNQVSRVDFLARTANGADVWLGRDLDGWEPPVATTHEIRPAGDGWFLDFDPALVRADPGPVTFTAILSYVDGSVHAVTADSWYAPDLGPEELVEPFEHWEIIHNESFVVRAGPGVLPGTQIGWALGVKNLEWSRSVPPESQRGVSDTHCAPTAAGACLEWLDSTYGTSITGGLSGGALTRALGAYMGTNSDPAAPGTKPSNMAGGLQTWIDDHGGGYTVHSEIPATTAGMQNQGEAQGQDVIAILNWAGGGAHAVTLSSIHNLPNADGTVSLDFMDPWTGGTQWGDFNPATGAFSNYGDSGDSGTLGRATYVSPTQGAPGGDERTLWLPFDGAVPIPVPEGLSWVKLSFCNPQGLATELFAIVERRAPEAPVVDIELVDSGQTIRLSWAPVPGALAYRIYRAADGYFGPDMEPWLETEHAFALDATEPAGTRWCYKVTTVYAQ